MRSDKNVPSVAVGDLMMLSHHHLAEAVASCIACPTEYERKKSEIAAVGIISRGVMHSKLIFSSTSEDLLYHKVAEEVHIPSTHRKI